MEARPLPGSFVADAGVISQAAERIADARGVGGRPGTKDEKRCLRLLRTMTHASPAPRRIGLMELRALFMSLGVQTFSRYGWAYWKFLVKGLLARPRMAAETLTMAVRGHHFFRITRNLLELDRVKAALEARVSRSARAPGI